MRKEEKVYEWKKMFVRHDISMIGTVLTDWLKLEIQTSPFPYCFLACPTQYGFSLPACCRTKCYTFFNFFLLPSYLLHDTFYKLFGCLNFATVIPFFTVFVSSKIFACHCSIFKSIFGSHLVYHQKCGNHLSTIDKSKKELSCKYSLEI